MGVIGVGGVDDAGKHRRFIKVEFPGRLAVIVFRRFLNAADISGSAEVHLVEIHLKDGLLVGLLFQLPRQSDLLNLVFDIAAGGDAGLIVLEIGQLDQLHRKRRSARQAASAPELVEDVVDRRLGETGQIKAAVNEIAAVLYRQERVDHGFGDLVIAHVFPELRADVGDQCAVAVIDMRAFGREEIIDHKFWFVLKHIADEKKTCRANDHLKTDHHD